MTMLQPLDATEAVGAVFERAKLKQGIDVESFGGFNQTGYFDGPGAGGQPPGVLGGVALIGPELVVVVVVGDIAEAGQLFAGC